jgi:hypothetical protein
MIKRIQEFEKQCWSHTINGVLIDGSLHFDTQKFAELIIMECANIALREDHDPYECILKHFGVKK